MKDEERGKKEKGISFPPRSVFPFSLFSTSRSPFCVMRGERGTSLLEMALTLPVILLLILAAFDLGRAVFIQNVIANAAREGAHYGAIAPNDTQAIQTQTENFIFGVDPNAVTITITVTSNTVRVTITYTFTPITPLIGNALGQGGSITLKAVSTMNIESAL